jgi:hypothetical protein
MLVLNSLRSTRGSYWECIPPSQREPIRPEPKPKMFVISSLDNRNSVPLFWFSWFAFVRDFDGPRNEDMGELPLMD